MRENGTVRLSSSGESVTDSTMLPTKGNRKIYHGERPVANTANRRDSTFLYKWNL